MSEAQVQDKRKDFRLYATKVTPENAQEAYTERFHRITPNYILAYAKDHPGKTWTLIEGQNLRRMTKQDEQWLFDCITALTAELIKAREKEVEANLSDLVDRLEKELELEAEAANAKR